MATTHKSHVVTRSLQVEGLLRVECEAIMVDRLSVMTGMIKVEPAWQKGEVTVTYDLHETRIQDVEKWLSDIGYPPATGFFAQKKRDWLHFTEKNEVDNLKHRGHCCSKPPVGATG